MSGRSRGSPRLGKRRRGRTPRILQDDGTADSKPNLIDAGDNKTVVGKSVWGIGHSAQLEDYYACLAEGRAYRGSRSRLARGDLEFSIANYFLCHLKCTS